MFIRAIHFDFSIDAAGAQNRGVDQVGPIRSENNHHIVERIDPIHFRAKHGDERGQDVRVTRGAARAEDRLGFVDKQERHETFAAFFARGGKNFAHHSFRFADPHVQNLRAFDVHEIFPHLDAAFFTKLLRQIVSGRFPNQRFSTAGWPVEQKTLGRGMLKFCEKIDMQKRKLDRVLDRLQRRLLSADFLPR